MPQKGKGILILGLCVLSLLVETDSAQGRFLNPRQAQSAPRGRIACLPSSTMVVRYPDSFALGNHSYGFSISERNGIVYTCRGGHIDITHLRKLADWTAYLTSRLHEALLLDHQEFSFRMREASLYHAHIEYPTSWRDLPSEDRDALAREVAIDLAQYLAYTGSTWHEILTWFGYKGAGIWPEYQSAFSWEDNYSNLLGCRIGAAALRDPDRDFEKAVTGLLDAELRALGVQPKRTARQAAESVRNWWFTGWLWSCRIVRRHLDIGLDDGIVTPCLIPDLADCDGAIPQEYPAPTLSGVEQRGFSICFEIEPKEWERKKILRIVRGDNERTERIEPARHFGAIIECIRGQAVARYGPFVDDCCAKPATDPRSDRSRSVNFEDIATLAAQWLMEDSS
ncbi:MAG TPA: DUF4056 domain-containing protein [Sedimentisphaerales bacterium]|nr:DUF4056 domain-containing protein [Sedimentisphaerales bacterium]